MSLEDGIKALQQQQYASAIEFLEDYCKYPANQNTPAYIQALMALARAYRGNQQRDKAFAIANSLQNYQEPQISEWAKGFISILQVEEKATNITSCVGAITEEKKPLRLSDPKVSLPLPKAKFHLRLASYITSFLIFIILFSFDFVLIGVINQNTIERLMMSLGLSLTLILILFLASPFVLDLNHKWLYKLQWINLSTLRKYSAESANLMSKFSREQKVKVPRLGIIDNRTPVIFTYGIFPNKARIIATTGLFKSLTDEEIAAVYAHELGHILQRNLALMTVATVVIEPVYSFYWFLKNLGKNNSNKNKLVGIISYLSIVPYLLYLLSNLLMFYLSRNREYCADHFAVEATGNPNGLARALVKIAYGLLEQKPAQSSPLIPMTRILSIYDAKAALIPGTAYRLTADFRQIGQIFLWDLFNPWANWLELSSPSPVIGKRIHSLMNYAQLLNLENQFNTLAVQVKGNQLNKRKLYTNFVGELLIFNAQWLGMIAGIIVGCLLREHLETGIGIISLAVVGFGGGNLLQTWVMYPKITTPSQADFYSLICDPYASPLKAYPVQIQGKLIGQAEVIYDWEPDIMIKESSAMIYAHYCSPFGALGNFFFSWAKIKNFIGCEVNMIGWFHRGLSPWIDWSHISSHISGDLISWKHYPRFWSLLRGTGVIIVGLIMLVYAIGTHRLTMG